MPSSPRVGVLQLDSQAAMTELERLWPTLAPDGAIVVGSPNSPDIDRFLRGFAVDSGVAYLVDPADGTAVLAQTEAVVRGLVAAGCAERLPLRPLERVRSDRRVRLLLRASPVRRAPLRIVGDSPESADDGLRRFAWNTQPGHVVEHVFKDAEVCFDMSFATRRGPVKESHRFVSAQHSVERLAAAELIDTVDAALLVSVHSDSNYSHWLVESLLSLWLERRLRPGRPLTIITGPLNAFERESLDMLGEPDIRIVEIGEPQKLGVRALTVLSPWLGGVAFRPRAETLQLFDRLLQAATAAAPLSAPHRRLYISRSDSRKRRLVNEAALEAALAQRGFEIVVLSGRSLAEQARLFAEASIVVGPHGAGLTNLGFCRPGTRVLELHASHYIGTAMFRLAELAELDPYLYVGASSEDGDMRRHRRTWSVDLRRVLLCVDQLLETGTIHGAFWHGPDRCTQ